MLATLYGLSLLTIWNLRRAMRPTANLRFGTLRLPPGAVVFGDHRRGALLPEGAAVKLLEWCGLTGCDDVRERLIHVAQFDAKTPSLSYDATGATTASARNEQAIRSSCAFVAPYYEQLESIRLF